MLSYKQQHLHVAYSNYNWHRPVIKTLTFLQNKKPIARLIGQLRRVILLPNIAFTVPDEGEFCLTEILGNNITLLSCPISLAIGFSSMRCLNQFESIWHVNFVATNQNSRSNGSKKKTISFPGTYLFSPYGTSSLQRTERDKTLGTKLRKREVRDAARCFTDCNGLPFSSGFLSIQGVFAFVFEVCWHSAWDSTHEVLDLYSTSTGHSY